MAFVPTTMRSTTDFFYQTSWRGFSPVFDQNTMSICWAVVAADSVVGLAKANGLLMEESHANVPPLGVQQILDNMPFYNYNYAPCRREEAGYFGQVPHAFEYIRDFGIHTATAYPFQRRTGYQGATVEGHDYMLANGSESNYGARVLERIKIGNFSDLQSYDFDMNTYVGLVAKKLKEQPLAAGIYVSQHFDRFRGNGIFEDIPNASRYAHAVMLTGFGHESGAKERLFWEIKNSAGLEFGDWGYAKIPIELIHVIWYPTDVEIRRSADEEVEGRDDAGNQVRMEGDGAIN